MADIRPTRDDLYKEAVASCGTALDCIARAYEADPDKRRDLLQEIHVALWRSFDAHILRKTESTGCTQAAA